MVAGLTTSLLSLLLPVIILAGPHGSNRHYDLARREITHTGARLTFYNGGGALGSCGTPIIDADFTVALNAAEMNPSLCSVTITITYNGKSAQARIKDTCPGCPPGGLDLTQGLFEHFADTSVGVIYGNWKTDDSASAPPLAQSSALAPHPPSSKPTSTLPPSLKPTSTLPPSPQPTSTHPPSSKLTSTLPPSLKPTSTLPPSPQPTSTLPPSSQPTSTLPPSRHPTSALPPSLKPTSTLHFSNGAASKHVELTDTVLSSLLVCLIIVLNNHIIHVVSLTCTSG